jgi:hypothetical protein
MFFFRETGEKNTDKEETEEKREEEISPTDGKISEREEQRDVTDKMEPYNEALSPKMVASGIILSWFKTWNSGKVTFV